MPSYHKPVHGPFFNGPLYDKMADDLHLTGKAQRTVHGYLRAVRQLADYCRKSPEQISETKLRRYFLYLKNDRQAAYGTLRVALSGIQFFYRTTCPRNWNVLAMLKLKNVSTLPEVITREQVRQIILAAKTQRMRGFFWAADTERHSRIKAFQDHVIPGCCRSRVLSRSDQLTVARRFNAGCAVAQGKTRRVATIDPGAAFSISASQFQEQHLTLLARHGTELDRTRTIFGDALKCRYATRYRAWHATRPGVETPGYRRVSLRDMGWTQRVTRSHVFTSATQIAPNRVKCVLARTNPCGQFVVTAFMRCWKSRTIQTKTCTLGHIPQNVYT